MARQTLNLGTSADDGLGDTLRAGGDKINDNFEELYSRMFGLGLPIPTTGSPSDVVAHGVLFADADGNLAQGVGFRMEVVGASKSLEIEDAIAQVALITSDFGVIEVYSVDAGDWSYFSLSTSENDDAYLMLGVGPTGNIHSFSIGIDKSDNYAFVITNEWGLNGTNAMRIDRSTSQVRIPHLAGTGTRAVVVDASGNLSAP